MGDNHEPFSKYNKEGSKAKPGTQCPYEELGPRCSWLAGHYDAHGKEAAERATIDKSLLYLKG